MEALLRKIQDRFQHHDPSPQLECWLHDVGLAEDTDGQFALICPNSFSKRWLEERYRAPLERVIQEETGKQVGLTFRVSASPLKPQPQENHQQPAPPDPVADRAGTNRPKMAFPKADSQDGPISVPGSNPQFRFSNFVVGPSNRFAWSAAQEVCSGTQSPYNPLLLLSSTGLGKTHLAQAIAHHLACREPKLRVCYATAEGFFNEMIQHLKSRNISAFKGKYRQQCDALVLDDIQFVSGKTALQSELSHTLDALLHRGKRVVLAGDTLSRDDKGISDNLRSRLFSGLVVSMENPDYEMRLEILTRFSRNAGVAFPPETLEALARLIRSDVRDLEGAFKRVLAWHSLLRHPVEPENLEQQFKDLTRAAHKPLTLTDIRKHVAQYFVLSPEDLSSRSRQNKIVLPRQVGMYLSRKHTPKSLEDIGALYKRDHSSVLYALRSLERKAARSPRIRRELGFIEERLLEKN